MKKVWVFGDSTSAENINNPEKYEQAWSHFLRGYLIDDVEFKNVAVAGVALKWHYHCEAYKNGEIDYNVPQDSRWHQIVSEVQRDDVFIFFLGGINDHGNHGRDTYYLCKNGDYILDDFQKFFYNRDRYLYVGEGYGTHRFYTDTSTVEEFEEILSDMINQLKAKGAIPLILRGTGKYYMRNDNDVDVFPASHKYMEVLPSIAKKTNVSYLDIGSIFEQGFKTKGYKYMMENYFMTMAAVERLNIKYGRNNSTNYDDNCHHNLDGAKHICDIFIEELKKSDYPLKNYLK